MKNDWLKCIVNMLIFILIIVIFFIFFLFIIANIPTEKFRTSYQYTLNRKYNNFKNVNEPKIVILGGSSAAFGINTNIIEEKIKMPVVNLGLHAGFGTKFVCELSKANINEGDIVILAFEYDTYDNFIDENYFGVELVMSAIDANIEMYKYIPKENVIDVIKYIPMYVFKKIDAINKTSNNSGVYSIMAFDEYGNMIYDRKECILPLEIPIEIYGKVDSNKFKMTKETIDYLNNFSKYVENKGAKLLLTFPPILDEMFYVDENEINYFENKIDSTLNIKRISNINDYIFSRNYMYDTIYHCNNLGEKLRSEKLANDIKKFLDEGK